MRLVKINSLIVIFFLLSVFAFAEPVVEFDYLLQNNTASPINIRTYAGTLETGTIETIFSEYLLTLEDTEKRILRKVYFPAYFVVLDPFAEVEEIPVTITIPYHTEYQTAKVYHEKKLIAETNIRFLCNEDMICQQSENAVSCPNDCPQSSADGLCQRKEDMLCDPDCSIPEQECRKSELSTMAIFAWSLPLVFLIGVLGAFVVFLIDKIRLQRVMQQRTDQQQQIILRKKIQHTLIAAGIFAVLALLSAGIFFFL
ncbi:hypothetical protein HYX13_03925 [Candidatus Woesearchaeota archaeon]|nr:hypothetical protein [Candidatus Woesearchaeota archaeon]